jgi:hypothetical protein
VSEFAPFGTLIAFTSAAAHASTSISPSTIGITASSRTPSRLKKVLRAPFTIVNCFSAAARYLMLTSSPFTR